MSNRHALIPGGVLRALCFAIPAFVLLAIRPVRAQETTAPPPAGTSTVMAAVSSSNAPPAEADSVTRFSMFKRLQATGRTGMVQLLISVLALSFALERLFNLRAANVIPQGLAEEARKRWAAGRWDELKALCESRPSTLARVIAGLVKHRNGTTSDVSIYAGDLAGREMKRHLLRAYPLVVAATLETLLGLFGTVLGMVGAFEAVALAGKMGDPSIMAEDISFALMTTVVGLVVAVPSLAAYHFFRIRTNSLAMGLEEEVNELIADWFMKKGPDHADPSRG